LILPACLAAVGIAVVGLVVRLPLPLAFAAALTVIGLAAAAAWPFVGLLLFVGIAFVRPEDSFSELVGLRLALLIGSATFLAWALRSVSARRAPWLTPALGWLLAFAAAAFLSLLSLAPDAIASGVTELAKLVILFALVTQLARGERRTTAFCAALVALSSWLAVVSLVNYYTGHGFLSPQGFRARGTGAFADPNDTALALVPALPLAIVGVLDGRGFRRGAAAVAAALMLWAVYLTNSRGGMLALAGSLLVLAVLRAG